MLVVTLIIIALNTAATSSDDHQCSPGQPSTGGSATDDLKLVITLQYCLVDDCTIKRIDTGEELDIVYTTDSLLVVTVTGNQTSLVAVKSENEQSCVPADDRVIVIIQQVIHTLIALLNVYVLVLHLMFKELRTLLGKLLIIYSVCFLALYTSSKAAYLTQFTANSLFLCQILTMIFHLSRIAREASSTCMLACVVQMMHRSDNLRSKMPKHLLRNYFMYIFGSMALFSVITIIYHFITGKPVAPRSGPCQEANSAVLVPIVAVSFATLNKAMQIGLFTAYLFYFFKLNKERVIRKHILCLKLSKIAIILGATIGNVQVVWLTTVLAGIPYGNILGLLTYLVQHCIIASVYTCNKRMANRCRKKFHIGCGGQ